MSDSLNEMKQRFSRQLILLLERAYGGRLPSLSVLARDLSLNSPHLPHVSTETVRKWIRGGALPQSPRMQALVEWLGDELLDPLAQTAELSPRYFSSSFPGNVASSPTPSEALRLLEKLEASDRKLVLRLIQSLANKPANVTSSKPGSADDPMTELSAPPRSFNAQ